MIEFSPAEKEKTLVASSFFSCLEKLREAAQAIEDLHSLLEGEYIAIESGSREALSKQVERMSSCCFRLNVQRVKAERVGRVIKPEKPEAEC